MSTSRKRRDRRSTRSHSDDLSRYDPHVRQILRADEAERRGDAREALDLMLAMPDPPGGAPYWRPERFQRLAQLVAFDEALPGWATSRWLLEQALQDLDRPRRGQRLEALSTALEVRGGLGNVGHPPGEDARVKVLEHDWVYRQCLAYELGGLEHFVRHRAANSLVAGADRIREWMRAPMGGYRFAGRRPATTTWEDLETGEEIETANIGSAVLLVPGEHAIGRLVPIEGGRMFETVPLRVAEPVARGVAADPPGWLDVLRAARDGDDQPSTGGVRFGFLSDVPRAISLMATYDVPRLDASGAERARDLLRTAARALAGETPDAPEEVDVWPCLAAELLSHDVVAGLGKGLTPADLEILAALGRALADPAATVCRALVDEARRAA
jgi:hypothetical protein